MFYLLLVTIPKGIWILLPVLFVAFVMKQRIKPSDLLIEDLKTSSICTMEDIIRDLEYRQVKSPSRDLSQVDECNDDKIHSRRQVSERT